MSRCQANGRVPSLRVEACHKRGMDAHFSTSGLNRPVCMTQGFEQLVLWLQTSLNHHYCAFVFCFVVPISLSVYTKSGQVQASPPRFGLMPHYFMILVVWSRWNTFVKVVVLMAGVSKLLNWLILEMFGNFNQFYWLHNIFCCILHNKKFSSTLYFCYNLI